MLAVKTSPDTWTLMDCLPSNEENPKAMYVPGFGYVVRTYDEQTRVYRVVDSNFKRVK